MFLQLFKELFLIFRAHLLVKLMESLDVQHLHLRVKHLGELILHLLLQLLSELGFEAKSLVELLWIPLNYSTLILGILNIMWASEA